MDDRSNGKHLLRLLLLMINSMLHVSGDIDQEDFMVQKFLP